MSSYGSLRNISNSGENFSKQLIDLSNNYHVSVSGSPIFRPEFSIFLELYIAEKSGEVLSVTNIGLLTGLNATTMLRHVEALEEREWLIRTEDKSDRRKSYIRIAPKMMVLLDSVFPN